MRPLDIAIAGCGIAGLACATLLKRQGARVVVYDKLASPRPIGSGLILQPVGLHVLDELGVGARIRELGARIARLHGKSGRHTVLDVRYDALGRNAAHGVAVHRGALFQQIYDAALEAGAEIEPGMDVADASDGRLVFDGGSHSPRFDLIIDALGMRSPLAGPPPTPLPYGALWASLDFAGPFDPNALEQRYQAAHKMVGVLPIGLGAPAPRSPGRSRSGFASAEPGRQASDATQAGEAPALQCAFFWSLRHTDRAAWRARPLDAWKDDVRALWAETAPLLDQIAHHDDLVFAAYAHRTRAPVSRHAVHVGDSWHCASPQLGQGANMALLDALAFARALEAQSNLDAALGEYARLRQWHIRLYQLASWLFTPAYQSDSAAIAWLRDWLMSPISRIPPAPQLLAALVAGQWGAPLGAMRF